MSQASDLAFMLRTAPGHVLVVCGSDQADGILEEESETFDRGEGRLAVRGLNRSILVDPNTLPTLGKGSTVTVAGVSYKVLDPLERMVDGLARAQLVNP